MQIWTDYKNEPETQNSFQMGFISDQALQVIRDTHHMVLENGRGKNPSNPFYQRRLWDYGIYII